MSKTIEGNTKGFTSTQTSLSVAHKLRHLKTKTLSIASQRTRSFVSPLCHLLASSLPRHHILLDKADPPHTHHTHSVEWSACTLICQAVSATCPGLWVEVMTTESSLQEGHPSAPSTHTHISGVIRDNGVSPTTSTHTHTHTDFQNMDLTPYIRGCGP